jgi:hypothetical protein
MSGMNVPRKLRDERRQWWILIRAGNHLIKQIFLDHGLAAMI